MALDHRKFRSSKRFCCQEAGLLALSVTSRTNYMEVEVYFFVKEECLFPT